MKRSRLWSILMVCLLIPATLLIGSKLPGRSYYLISTLIIMETMLPFFFLFESRKPQARELVTIAVLCALATVSRVAFAFLPSFKPITGIIMIAGIAFGAEAGFLTGAISAFASNFFYTQGAWTPWQMMAYGFGGFLAGLLFHKRKKGTHPVLLAIFGFVTIVIAVGPILDLCSVFTVLTNVTMESFGLVLLRGVPANVTHGVSCSVTMMLFSKPLLEKLNRLKVKYGMLDV